MVSSDATTPDEYIASLPEDRRSAVERVRQVIRDHIPDGYEEGMQYRMIGWYVPLDRFADTYNGQPLGLAALASQKRHLSLYLNNVYGDPVTEAWFKERYAASGKKLDMGKSCLRFRHVDDLSLDVIGETVARTSVDDFVAYYERARGSSLRTRADASRSGSRAPRRPDD
ncbi:MAG: iron chaperone [Candidatus Limnocylindria bacterium]